MSESSPLSRRIAAVLLCLSIVAGAWLRLSGLERRSISHPEMYVPGIPLPEGISEPAPRMTVSRILTGTFSSDTHPPGYYLFMLPWTRVMGTTLRAIRLPSAVLGLACIPLVFLLGSLAGWRLAGAVAGALLAASGYHVFWSQVARMFALNCFIGLAASLLLVIIVRGSKNRSWLTGLYVILMLAGVATHVFFWTLFAAHLLWAFANAWGKRELPDFCRAQLLALVLGSPLLAFAAYQSANTVAELSGNGLVFLAEWLPFAFLLPTSDSGFFQSSVPFTGTAWSWAIRAAILVIAVMLLFNGVRTIFARIDRRVPESPESVRSPLWPQSWIAAALIGALEIAFFLYLVRQLPPEFIHSSIKVTKALVALPLLLAGFAIYLDRNWGRLPKPARWMDVVKGEPAFLAVLGIVPFTLLAGFALFRPILNQRGLLFTSPYLFLLLSIGLVTLRKQWIAVLTPVLVLSCAASSVAYRQMMVDPADYAQFASAITSEIRGNDLVFIRKAWYETPILYYLRSDGLVGRDYASACARRPEARVWVVLLYDDDPAQEMQTALAGYRPIRTIRAPHAKAILYVGQGVLRAGVN